MIVVGELINASRKGIGEAILNSDAAAEKERYESLLPILSGTD